MLFLQQSALLIAAAAATADSTQLPEASFYPFLDHRPTDNNAAAYVRDKSCVLQANLFVGAADGGRQREREGRRDREAGRETQSGKR